MNFEKLVFNSIDEYVEYLIEVVKVEHKNINDVYSIAFNDFENGLVEIVGQEIAGK